MIDPVLSCIQGQREFPDLVLVNAVVKLKEYAQAYSRKKSMRGPWENVKAGNMFGICDAIGDQVLSHGKV
jgi:hypothetical protein